MHPKFYVSMNPQFQIEIKILSCLIVYAESSIELLGTGKLSIINKFALKQK